MTTHPLKVELQDRVIPDGVHAARASDLSPGHYRTACNGGFDTGSKLTWHPHGTPVTCARCQRAVS